MISHTKHLVISTEDRVQFINITDDVQREVTKSGIKEGLVLVNAMHITASVFINDEESGLKQDFKDFLEMISPMKGVYLHNNTGEDNGYAHIWRTIMGREVTVAISNGKLDFGPWEQIFYGEFDGQRSKRVMVKVIGD